jgi:hypothetical protein
MEVGLSWTRKGSHSEGGERGGEKNYINSRPQRINYGLELSSDNPFGHPHNLEENLFNNKSAEGFSDEHTIRSHAALEVSGCFAYTQQPHTPED